MSVIVDTDLYERSIKTELFDAFLYGLFVGNYTMYKNLENGTIAIRFDCGEDATKFKLQDLENIFTTRYSSGRDTFDNEPPF